MAVAPTCLAPVRAALLRATRGRWLAPSLKVWPSGQWRGISSAASMAEVVVGMKRARSVVQSEISLTPQEAAVCKTLSDAKEFAGSETVIRIVGGWVRDKVLGMESDDIDIALDDVSGADFAERVLAYLKAQGVETSKLAVIERNPEQSKHLETATMKVEGVSVDFVGLRAEEYAAGSRIPEVRLGTAEEDALRRDLTINALFYRVDTGAIEDLTGRGLDDLRAGVARTPLEPMQTFTDDPLRVLRAIRFAARFDLKVDGALAAAAASDTVREALDTKVSRERLGTEVQKMMEGPDPMRAVYLLASLSLWDVVFRMPDEDDVHREDRVGGAVVSSAATLPPEGFAVAGLHCVLLVHRLAQPGVNMASLLPAGPLKLSLLWWCALCLPLRHHMTRFKKANTQTLVEFLHRESLKGLPLTDATNVSKVVNASDALRAAVSEHADGKELDRVAVGLLVKDLQELWRPALLVACASELYDDPMLGPALVAAEAAGGAWAELVEFAGDAEAEPEEDVATARAGALAAEGSVFHPSCVLTLRARGEAKMEFGIPFTAAHLVRCARYVAFAEQLEVAGLHEAWKIKPPVSSKVLMTQLGVKGPAVGKYNTLALHWQLANPSGTAEECMEMLRQHKAEGK